MLWSTLFHKIRKQPAKYIPLCGQESDIGLSQRIRIVSFWEKHGEMDFPCWMKNP